MFDRIKTIYQNHINTPEFFEKSRDADIDISWIEKKISRKNYLKLEENITAYQTRNGAALFESGFIYAWELFEQCEKGRREKYL